MGVEGAAGKAEVGRAVLAEALHQVLATADHTDRQAAAQRLAVGHQVGLDAEELLRAAGRQAEAHEHLVEDQHDAALGADLAQLLQPGGVGSAVEARALAAGHQRRIARRALVGVQRLQRVDQHAGDVLAAAQHAQRGLVHLLERVGGLGSGRIARAGLNVVPPAVVSAAETHQVAAPGVVARQPHRLHHGLGAAHVEGDFVQPGDRAQALHVVGHAGQVSAQHRAERGGARAALGDALLVEVDAEHVDAVRAGEVEEVVAVEVGHLHAARPGDEGRHPDLLSQIAAVLEGHAVAGGELQVGQAVGGLSGERGRAREALAEQFSQLLQADAALRHDIGRRAVRVEETGLVVAVARHLRGHALGHPRMAGQRRVLGSRELQPAPCGRQDHGQRGQRQGRQGKSGVHRVARCASQVSMPQVYQSTLTTP